MIDWQIRVDGREPPGWDPHRDGCWFPDFDHQEYLLPYFDVGDSPIDPYGGTEFGAADLKRLRDHLSANRCCFEAKSDSWTLTETAGNQSRTITLNRDQVLAIIDKTLRMTEFALSHGGTLVFLGD